MTVMGTLPGWLPDNSSQKIDIRAHPAKFLGAAEVGIPQVLAPQETNRQFNWIAVGECETPTSIVRYTRAGPRIRWLTFVGDPAAR